MRYLMVVLSVLLFSGCISSSLSMRQGITSFRAQDYRSAFIRLKPQALRGQPDAQYAVGYMYYYGQGVVEDRNKARVWISKAAQAGQPDAIRALPLLRC